MTEYSIGLDLGGTNYRAAAVDRQGNLLERVAGSTDSEGGREAVMDSLVKAIDQLRKQLGETGLVGIGIGVPGFILMEKGYIVGSNNLPYFESFPVRDELEARLKAKVILENDANAAALGEHWIGAGKSVRDLILITLGTGIGGGIISDGKILHGYLGMAGEIGHMTVVANGNPCGCGNYGCLEKHASASAISAMARLLGLGDDVTAFDVHEEAKHGNERALMIFHSMGLALGVALANIVNLFNFPLYLLSGGPLPAWDFFAPSMLAECEARSFGYRHSKPAVAKAELGSDAGLYGAAYLPFQAAQKA